jgi:hypothetical protein
MITVMVSKIFDKNKNYPQKEDDFQKSKVKIFCAKTCFSQILGSHIFVTKCTTGKIKHVLETSILSRFFIFYYILSLKGVSHEIDFKNFNKNIQNLASLRDTAGF